MSSDPINRREFVENTAKLALGAAAAPRELFTILPRRVLGGPGYRPPSRTLNVACVGIGGMGMNNMASLLKGGENVVAICDVDFPYVERSLWERLQPPRPTEAPPTAEQLKAREEAHATALKLQDAYTKATKYADFREMLDKQQKDIDAVVIATPDHMHATIAHAAMKLGKHVYVQKPLTYSVYEARLLAKTAKETGVATQMGNQGHSFEGTRRINELISAGIIGPVREVHIWTDRPQRYWAQGIPRPGQNSAPAQPVASSAPAPSQPQAQNHPPGPPPAPRWNVRTVENAVLKAMAENPQTPPEGLHWDLFLGAAPEVPYHPVYHPFSWRGWVDFGVSAIGDMGAHLIDQPYWALGLTYPTSIESVSTAWGGPARSPASYPSAMITKYEFPAVGRRAAVKVFWYDGGMMPLHTQGLLEDVVLPRGDGGGGVFVGEKGVITYETYGNNPKVYPESLAQKAANVPKTFPRIEVAHEVNWAQACKGEAKASSPFEYAAALTETMLLGIVALRAGQAKKLLYDGTNMKVTNVPEANQYLTRQYRSGWEL